MLTILAGAEKLLPNAAKERLKRWKFAQRLYERAVIIGQFRSRFGRRPNLRHPETFNEKVLFKMLYDRRPVLTQMVDKVAARDYVAQRIGREFLKETYQVCDSFDQIRWDQLPSSFAMKTNHGTRMNILVQDKSSLDKQLTESQFKVWLSRNFYHHLREWAYRDVRPKIIIEELLHGAPGQPPVEWQFYVFNEYAACLEAAFGPYGQRRRRTFFDRNLKRMNGRWTMFGDLPEDPIFPKNMDAMTSVAERLARGHDLVRVDLFNIAGRIVFGELTVYPGAGLVATEPPEFDRLLGQMWRLPRRYQ